MKNDTKTVEECASAFITGLTKEEIAYCMDEERAEYMGFAALHDLMDANIELVEAITALGMPFDQCPIREEFWEEQIPFLNKVMDQVNVQLKEES